MSELNAMLPHAVGRMLVVSHVSLAERVVTALVEDGRLVDFLVYGRAATDLPDLPGAERLHIPLLVARPRTAMSLLRFMADLRRRRYGLAVIAQPSLERNRMRGPLRLFPHLAGARRVVHLLTPIDRGPAKSVPLGSAVADAIVWSVAQVGAAALAAAGPAVVARIERDAPRRPPPASGDVIYLRTDVELALAPLEAGGSVAHAAGVIGALRRQGRRVRVWSTGAIRGIECDGEARLRIPGLANAPQEAIEFLSGLWQGLMPPRQSGPAPAFVYQRYSLNNLTGLLLSRRWGVPLILEANDSEVRWRLEWSSLRYPALARACERAVVAGADRVVAVSHNARSQLAQETRVAEERIRVVPNGVDVDRFARATPARLPFEAGTVVLGFAGLFYPWHGVRFLAEAFVLLAREAPGARLLLVGDGDYASEVRAILRSGGVLDRCHMTGLVRPDEVPGYLSAADVLVSPHAAIEGFIGSPIKVFEYMASGRAIVASRLAQIGEVLEHERTALLVTPEDPPQLAAAALRLVRDPALRKRLGAAAQREAAERHSWDARVRDILRSPL